MDKIKIMLCDDEFLIRQGVKMLLQIESRIEVIGEAEDGQDLINKLTNLEVRPDIVITDLNMPNLNGVELTKVLIKKFPKIKIIALTSYFTKSFIVNMISLGAVGYLNKSSAPDLMINTILKVHEMGFFYTEEVLKYIQDGLLKKGQYSVKSQFDENYLTKREKQVLTLICSEYSSVEIAEKLFISSRTVEGHRNNLILKTGVKNVAGLVVFAISNKLVDLDFNSF